MSTSTRPTRLLVVLDLNAVFTDLEFRYLALVRIEAEGGLEVTGGIRPETVGLVTVDIDAGGGLTQTDVAELHRSDTSVGLGVEALTGDGELLVDHDLGVAVVIDGINRSSEIEGVDGDEGGE